VSRPGKLPPDAPAPAPALDVVQSWFQAVVTHPGGVEEGVASPGARQLVRLDRGQLEAMVRRSSRLTAEERLSIYANAYYARLLECLGDCLPVLKRVVGAPVFDAFAFDYLQRYPSRSYTLDRLAENFPRFLQETRPDDAKPIGAAEPGWPDFLIDLATFEWSIAKVFDGPGAEGQALLTAADLAALLGGGAGDAVGGAGAAGGVATDPAAAARFAASRLVPVPCLRLLSLRFPINAFYSAALAAPDAGGAAGESDGDGESGLAIPDPQPEHVALSRTDYVVRRYALTPFEHGLLAALAAGQSVGEAIAAAATASELPDAALAAELNAAFRRFTAAGLFCSLTS
jgi:Putative DNA-binding domain